MDIWFVEIGMAKKKADEQFTAARQRCVSDPDEAWRELEAQNKPAPTRLVPAPQPGAKPGPALPMEDRTGIPLIDWLCANMAQPEPLMPPMAAGDLAMLHYWQSNPADFYSKVFMPALLKRHSVLPPPPDRNDDDDDLEPDLATRT